MGKKLYALFILVGAVGAIVLMYLYFFVYYTSTLTVNANVGGYSVELFSKSTAQIRVVNCPLSDCVIQDVSPFEYNISILKDEYQTQSVSIKVSPRRSESLVIELEKKVSLTELVLEKVIETPKQKITRLRAENRSYARFDLGNEIFLSFKELDSNLQMSFEKSGNIKNIAEFSKVPASEILVDTISSSDSVYLSIGENKYIFETAKGKLLELDFQIQIRYIKSGTGAEEYIVITEKGAFVYNGNSGVSEFQYLFQDYVTINNEFIGIIFANEVQKRKNLSLEQETGNLVIKYNPQDKTRKVIYQTDQDISRIVKQESKIILTVGGEKFELNNY